MPMSDVTQSFPRTRTLILKKSCARGGQLSRAGRQSALWRQRSTTQQLHKTAFNFSVDFRAIFNAVFPVIFFMLAALFNFFVDGKITYEAILILK
jgi:hypothetical protein